MGKQGIKSRYIISIVMVFIIGFLAAITLLCFRNSTAKAETTVSYEQLLNNYQSYIGTGAHFKLEGNSAQVVDTNKDDPIVNLVPKEYFYTEGDHLGFGEKHGYFVNTVHADSALVNNENYYFVIVLVFKVDTNTDLKGTVDDVIVTVSPLYEYRYYCMKGNGHVSVSGFSVEYDIQNYCVVPYLESLYNNIYNQSEYFYIKDVSIGGMLYNEQHLNAGDQNYIAENDYGSYFTSLDYEYSGKTREYGEFPTDEAITLGTDVVNLAVGAIEAIPVIGNVVSVIDNIFTISSDVINFGVAFSKYTEGVVVADEKKITTVNQYNNRYDQLAYYRDKNGKPALAKAAMVSCNTANDHSLWYGKNDYARAHFRVNHGGGGGITPYYTRFVSNIALKVVQSNNENTVLATGKGEFDSNLRNVEYKTIQMSEPASVYMLPDGVDKFNFTAAYDSDYEIAVYLDNEADIKINNVTYHCKDKVVSQYIQANSGVSIELSGNTKGLSGTVTVNANASKTATKILASGKYLMKVGLSDVKTLKTSNANVCVKSFYTIKNGVLSQYRQYGDIVADDTVTYPFDTIVSSEYYVEFTNRSSQTVNGWNLTVTDVQTVYKGNSNKIDLRSDNFGYVKIVANATSNFVFSLPNTVGNNFEYRFLNSTLDTVGGFTYIGGVYIVPMEKNKVYYLGIKTGHIENNTELLFNESANAYHWKVTGGVIISGGMTIYDRRAELERGYSYNVKFYINGKEKDTPVFSEDSSTSYGLYGFSVNSDTHQFTIPLSAPIGGNGIEVKAWASVENDTSYNHTLRIIPKFENRTRSFTITNDEDVSLNVKLGKYINKAEYQITFSSRTTTHLIAFPDYLNTAENANSISILSQIKAISNNIAGYATVRLTRVYYMDALKTQKSVSYGSSESYGTVHTLYANGSGTGSYPYELSCMRHLDNVRQTCVSTEYYYKLIKDVYPDSDWGYWTPIKEFHGDFDGNNHSITYLKFDDNFNKNNTNIGLFGIIENKAVVKNLTMGAIYLNQNSWRGEKDKFPASDVLFNIGTIAGINRGRIKNCKGGYLHHYAEVSFITYSNVNLGTICGSNENLITNCDVLYTELNITRGNVGGVVGMNTGTVSNCTVDFAQISCYNQFPDKNDKNSPTLYGDKHYGRAGGIVGENTNSIYNCSVEYNVDISCYGSSYDGHDYSYAPEMGIICGKSSNNPSSCNMNSNVRVNKNALHTVTWVEKIGWFKKVTHTHDQAKYVGARAVGHMA